MLIKAEQKYIRMSPRKLRLVASLVKPGQKPSEVLAFLQFVQKRQAAVLVKVLKQAVANATKNKNLSHDTLRIKELRVNAGPIYKRGMPVSRGRLYPIQKKTSHVTVILESETQEKQQVKSEKREGEMEKEK